MKEGSDQQNDNFRHQIMDKRYPLIFEKVFDNLGADVKTCQILMTIFANLGGVGELQKNNLPINHFKGHLNGHGGHLEVIWRSSNLILKKNKKYPIIGQPCLL